MLEVERELIEKTPGICGGKARIAGTRIPIWGLERARRRGLSNYRILLRYPSLSLNDLSAAWEYVRKHPAEIARQFRENEEA